MINAKTTKGWRWFPPPPSRKKKLRNMANAQPVFRTSEGTNTRRKNEDCTNQGESRTAGTVKNAVYSRRRPSLYFLAYGSSPGIWFLFLKDISRRKFSRPKSKKYSNSERPLPRLKLRLRPRLQPSTKPTLGLRLYSVARRWASRR